jgi:hypothetical protein
MRITYMQHSATPLSLRTVLQLDSDTRRPAHCYSSLTVHVSDRLPPGIGAVSLQLEVSFWVACLQYLLGNVLQSWKGHGLGQSQVLDYL